MSLTPISRSADLKRLRDEGYDVELRADPAYLLVHDVPYVDTDTTVRRGTLVSTLQLAGDETTTPDTHVVMFIGDVPCDDRGEPLTKIINNSDHQVLAGDLEIDHTFSSKSPDGYADYHAKMTTYISILVGYAQAIEPLITAQTFPVIEPDDRDTVFHYLDTATSRAGIGGVTSKLKVPAVAIVGLGGTGSYVLDLMAKTAVRELHLFDGDQYLQHGAFRSPGAPSVEILRTKPLKVGYFAALYGNMRAGIVPHPEYIDESNVHLLRDMDFVFLCVDDADARALVVGLLEAHSVSFIDVGMGVQVVNGSLGGVLRTTTGAGTDRHRAHAHLPLAKPDARNDYVHNIQIADLNALNAALAVIKWKKLRGFYRDLEGEHHSCYTIDGNRLTNENGTDAG